MGVGFAKCQFLRRVAGFIAAAYKRRFRSSAFARLDDRHFSNLMATLNGLFFGRSAVHLYPSGTDEHSID
jgi:hypothetical protein